ncbi:3-hydroxyacyl-ACP dehydratase FabZ family protein [Nocardia sp. NPDC057663]|uniref:3-hydroxyacyl-ACP dehydratase FabZ family protein n=1 Tax=Nocardia sp. NPDC057663 TaxID=3346201 RepID=UPI00366F3088
MSEPQVLLDRVFEVEAGVRGSALSNVPATLPVFDSHFPRFPVLPGVLLLERMAALAVLVAPSHLNRQQSILGARFRRYVEPGDQIRLTVEATAVTADYFECRAVAEVDGRTVATVRTLRLEQDRGTR